MKFEDIFQKKFIISSVAAVLIMLVAVIFFRGEKFFLLLILFSMVLIALPFLLSVMKETETEKENNAKFLEFIRNIVENVKSGTPISTSILNIRNQNYGTLTPHVRKMANQISMGITVKKAMENFAKDVNSSVVTKAINLISEADRAGGDIEEILESVSGSVNDIDKLRKERKSSISNLVVQGYIIFLIFVVIILIMQIKIIPLTAELATSGSFSPEEMARPLFYLLLAQGFFTGLVVGKLAEGKVKAGIKHSFFIVVLALLIYSVVRIFF